MKEHKGADGRRLRPLLDRTGQRFGRLTVIGLSERDHSPTRRHRWLAVCDCGKEKVANAWLLTQGHTQSCGCLARETLVARNTTHGLSRAHSKAYRSWKDMRARCNNPNDSDYKDYGGRGIRVCERWDDFSAFYEDMGDRLPGLTIDRIDTNGDYEPGNCRWTDANTQANNKRSNRIVEYRGMEMTMMQLSRLCGVGVGTISYRLKIGYPIEVAVNSKIDLRQCK